MSIELHPDLIAADRALHELLVTHSFSPHLNPVNIDEARQAFFDGADSPPFAYAPLLAADEILRALDPIQPSDEPFGSELARSAHELRLLVLALRDRSAAAFDALNTAADWYPQPEDPRPVLRRPKIPDGPPTLDADHMHDALRAALDARGLEAWEIRRDPVMSARVLVDGAKRLIRLNPAARFRALDLRTLVAHEIDVHALRSHNGAQQRLHLFQDGLPGSLQTEEGLAVSAELRVSGLPAGFLERQQLFVTAVELARHEGFRTVFETLCGLVSPGMAWGVTLRVKRGLARPDEPGVYAKDTVYARGFAQVHTWLEAGNDVARLYVGKVGLLDPVDQWVREGWLRPIAAPELWA